ncbi:MAG: polynucleotide adenylyltransferase, partial [Candidatus Flemingiibacterium sp.]
MSLPELPGFAEAVMERLERAGYEAFAVGGCVRDPLLGLTPNDWDVTTDARPERVAELFSEPPFRAIPTGMAHGTVTVLSSGEPVEVTTYRIDGEYTDCRRPDSVSFTSSLEADLARRDFTINAMAYSPKRGLIDP